MEQLLKKSHRKPFK